MSALPAGLKLPPLPLLPPSALTADAGNGRVFLRWNPQWEDERVVGWKVLQLAPQNRTLTDQPLAEPHYVAKGLTNGTSCEFAVLGMLADGTATAPSNAVTVTPREVGKAKVHGLSDREKLQVGPFADLPVSRFNAKVIFPDGQELIYDRLRPVDWKARDGRHLIYPRHFGNGLDVGRFDKRGLPVVIPPGGLKADHVDLDGREWAAVVAPADGARLDGGAFEYRDVQHGYPHPSITDPVTLPLAGKLHGDERIVWKSPTVDGDRVTFHYWQPMKLAGYHSWNYILVWETWWPIERERHGTTYHGLARLVEVQVPSAWRDGYQVMLNNGFGPDGRRTGVVSYSTGFRRPAHEIVDFSGETNRQVFFQHPKLPREGSGYHPNQDCLQSSPLVFYDWAGGSMTITARSLYYHCANNSSSYIEQGADGVWPNLAWDLAAGGRRVAVDTVEYLYAPDTSQPLPQRYLNARMEVLGDISKRMGLQDDLAATMSYGTLGQVKGDGGPVKHAAKQIALLAGSGFDSVDTFHDFWHAVPITVDDAYRLDPNHDCNPQIKAMCDKFHEAGYRVGFWYRPEFAKTSLMNCFSDTIPTAETYYGYERCAYPNVVELLKRRGIPLGRENRQWLRCQIDGAMPVGTPYQWVPMSMAGEWWDRVMWPTLWMSRQLGFDWLLMDGGFAGLQGVDYAPMRLGKAGGAVACQPYWWRMFRTMHHIGMRQFGECTVGWKGAFVTLAGEGDEHYLWMYQAGLIWGNYELGKPRQLHKLFQLYVGSGREREPDKLTAAVCRYGSKFLRDHRPPDWIELKDLRQADQVEVTVDVADSPVAGGPTRISKDNKLTFKVRPWIWTDVVWHYDDGTQAVYPAYDRIDWEK